MPTDTKRGPTRGAAQKCCFAVPRQLTTSLGVVAGIAVAGVLLRKAFAAKARADRRAMLKKLDQNRVTLFVFPRVNGLGLQLSAPCLKVETWLRLNNIPYDVVFTMDMAISPTECFPCIQYKGKTIAESGVIIEHLQKEFSKSDGLNDEQRAKSVLVTRLMEQDFKLHLYRCSWVDDVDTVADVQASCIDLPKMMIKLMCQHVRRDIIKSLNASGQGDLTDEQYHAEFSRDITTIETLLEKDFVLGGSKPTAVDACLFAYLNSTQQFGKAGCKSSSLTQFLSCQRIADYIQRMEKLAFPDKDALITSTATKHTFTPKE